MLAFKLLQCFLTAFSLHLTHSKEIVVERPRGVSLTSRLILLYQIN